MLNQLFRILLTLFKVTLILAVLAVIPLGFLVEHVSSQFEGNASLPADCAVVFGAAVHRQTQSGPGIQRRVATAARLYKEGKVNRLFMTGGKGDEQQDSEAMVMQRTAVQEGVRRRNIILEQEATSTWENLVKTKPLTEKRNCESVVGISDAYHLARIQYLADLQGWEELRTLPADKRPNTAFELRATVREALGLAYYWLNQYLPMERVIEPRSDMPVE